MLKQDLYLLAEWVKIHRAIGAIPNLREFFRLRKAYSGEGRFYHTWNHIYECLKFMNATYGPVPDGHLIKFALFYHDVVYTVPGPENELLSSYAWLVYADNFTHFSKMSRDHAHMVCDMIRMTKNHKPGPGQGLMFQMMSDIDMSILGADPERYLAYVMNIWREYSAVGKEAYIEGRLKFLSTVDPDKLFFTHQAKKLIPQAKLNISLEKGWLITNPERLLVS